MLLFFPTWAAALCALWVLWLVVRFKTCSKSKPPPIQVVREAKPGNGKPKLVMIHGWPDNTSLWDQSVEALAEDYDCIRLGLPNFDPRYKHCERSLWGYDFPQVTEALLEAIESVRDAKDEKVTLVVHDWGSLFGVMLCNAKPDCFDRMAMCDVGWGRSDENNLFWTLFIVWYQWTAAFIWLLPPLIGDPLNRAYNVFFQTPAAKEHRLDQIHAQMNYCYFYVWKRVLSGQFRSMRGDAPKCPVFFARGKQMPIKFFDRKWRDALSEAPNKYMEVDSDHWLMLGKAGEEWLRELKAWLQA